MVEASKSANRLLELDAMRGIAAMLVLLYHFNYKYVQYNPAHGALPLLFGWGHHGVSLFFAISGFVISMTVDRMDSVGGFARARFSRLFPVYWASMLITMAAVALGGAAKLMVSPAEAIANATMLHYWFDIQSVDGSYWSLSIELSFYCVMAVALHFRQLHRMEALLGGWLVLHVAQLYSGLLPVWAVRMLALDYIPLFAIGVIHYRYYRDRIGWQRAAAWHTALVAILSLSSLSMAIVALGTVLLFWAMTAGWLRFMAHPALLWLGAISYPLYLVHQYAGYVLIDHLAAAGLSLLSSTAIALLAVTLLAYWLHIAVEDPAQRRLRAVRRKPQAVAE